MFTTELLKEANAAEETNCQHYHVVDTNRRNLLLLTKYNPELTMKDVLLRLPLHELEQLEQAVRSETNIVIHCVLPTKADAKTNWFMYCNMDTTAMASMTPDYIDRFLLNTKPVEKHINA